MAFEWRSRLRVRGMAEDAAIQRGIEESIRAHREAVARGEVKPTPRPKTFEEIMGGGLLGRLVSGRLFQTIVL